MSLTPHYIACGNLADTAECAPKGGGCRRPAHTPPPGEPPERLLRGHLRPRPPSRQGGSSAPTPGLDATPTEWGGRAKAVASGGREYFPDATRSRSYGVRQSKPALPLSVIGQKGQSASCSRQSNVSPI